MQASNGNWIREKGGKQQIMVQPIQQKRMKLSKNIQSVYIDMFSYMKWEKVNMA